MLYWRNPSSSQMNDPMRSLKRIICKANYRNLNTTIYRKVMDKWDSQNPKVVLLWRLISIKIIKTVTNNVNKHPSAE